MDGVSDLRASTCRHFDSINFTELNDRWIDQVVENEFTDAEENSMTISILFVHDVISTLNKLAEICENWIQIGSAECEASISTALETSAGEEELWTVLQEMEIQVKHILGLVYLLCSRSLKKTSVLDDKVCALAAVNFYFNILRVPGSSAYSVFHRNLFCLCIDCLPAPDFTSDKDYSCSKEFGKVSEFYVSALLSLAKLLKEVNLGADSHSVEYVSKRLAELTACEVQTALNFDTSLGERELKRGKAGFIVANLAYRALSAIIESDLNGDQDHNYMYICSQLNKHILCLKAKKSQTISQKIHVIKDNAISFICYNLRNKKIEDFCSEVTQSALKRLCLGVIDKADFRSAISVALTTILYNLKIEHIAELIQWMLSLIDSADTKDRVFALEVFGLLLSRTFVMETGELPESLNVYLTKAPIIFAILTRCDDTSPVVRSRALFVASQSMKSILECLEETKDQQNFEQEESEETNPRDLDVNGNHRSFWYNLKSLRERLNEIANILQRRTEDNNVAARKAALVALESLMAFDKTYLTPENLKFFDFAARDANVVVRKQVIKSLSDILGAYHSNPQIQSSFLRCILPMVQDPENSVQAMALSSLEDQFLQKIFSSSEIDREISFSVLRMAASGDFLSHQRYLQKAFSVWKAERKLRPQVVTQLKKYMDTDWEECVWFYLSNFAVHCDLTSDMSLLCVAQFQKLTESGTFPAYMNHMIKVLNHAFKGLQPNTLLVIKDVICITLNELSVPVDLIPAYIEVLFKSFQHLGMELEFSTFSSGLLQKCERNLMEIKSNKSCSSEMPMEELLPKCFCIFKELCQVNETLINPNILSLLKIYSACEKPSSALSKVLTPSVRAHAFAALGKICLQDEILAKDLLAVYAQELLTSDLDVIRNNLVIILIEMCKRYTSFADKYVPLISLCFKDRLYLIRYQTIILLVNLLQEGYIKWRGPLFFCLLSTLNDKKEEIQELGRYSLTSLLQEKKKTLFSEHFVDSIFVFNGFPPPDNATLAQTVKDLDRFAMKGEYRREGRMHLYKFLLESMDVKERAYLVKSICEILMNIAEAVYPLEEITECIIRDCFAILTCKEIRAFNVEQITEDVDEAQEREFSKTELETRRIVIIDPVVPVIASLNTAVSDPGSDLAQDIIMFLKELLQDFRDSLKDILGIDKILLQTLELEIRNDAERERAEKRMEKDPPKERRQCSAGSQSDKRNGADSNGIRSTMDDVSDFLEETHVAQERGRANGPTSPKQLPTRSTRQQNKNPSSSGSHSPTKTYNITTASPAEVMDMQRFASTPRVVLKPIKISQASKNLNISAIEKAGEPMILEDSDEDIMM